MVQTWNDYKEHVRTVDPKIERTLIKLKISSIVSAMVEQRTALGLSQKSLLPCVVFHNHP